MTRLTSTRSKLANKIFEQLGSEAVLYPYSSTTTDKWDTTVAFSSSTAITVVPYAFNKTVKDKMPFGDFKTGEMTMLISYDTSLNELGKDRITYDGDNWQVEEVRKYPIQGTAVSGSEDGNLAFAVRLVKDLRA